MTADPAPTSAPAADAGEPPRRKLRYLPALEGIRGFALGAEMLTHLGLFVVLSAYDYLLPGGLTILSLFFVLSGFFITIMLVTEHDRNGRIDVRRFWLGRARRLYPPLLLILVLHWGIALHYGRSLTTEWQNNLWTLSGTIDYRYSVTHDPALASADAVIFWSIAAEIQFYLIWPFLVTFLLRRMRTLKRILSVLVFITLASTAVRTWQYLRWRDWLAVYYRFEGRIGAFALGSVLAFVWCRRDLDLTWFKRLAWPAWGLLLAAFWYVRPQDGYLYTWGFLALDIMSVVIVAACIDNRFVISRLLSMRGFRLVGRASYTFYIVHIQVYMWVAMERGHLPPWQKAALALGGTAVVGTLCYLVAERPVLKRPAVRKTPAPAGDPVSR